MFTRFHYPDELKLTEKLIYRTIHGTGGTSKKDLVDLLGGSVTTVSRFLASMEDAGLVVREDEDRKPGGRRPDRYFVRPDAMFAFGGFISSDGFGIGLSNAVGDLLGYRTAVLARTTTPEEVAEFFAEAIRGLLESSRVDRERVLGIGLGLLGPIRKQKGLMFHPHHLDSELWEVVPIRDIVELKTGMPTTIDSLTETMLINEIVYGNAKGAESAAFIWIDKGIGCAAYTKGILGIGNADLSSSVGHLVIDFKGEECKCGKRGCLETYGSIENLIRRFRSVNTKLDNAVAFLANNRPTNDFWEFDPALTEVQHFLETGRIPKQTSDEVANAFVYGITNFLTVARPQMVIYGGRTVANLPFLTNDVVNKIRALHRDDGVAETKTHFCRIDDESVIRGASLLCLNDHVGFVETAKGHQEISAR